MAGEEESGAEKPFEATPRKLEEARKRGEVPISQDLVTFGVYCGILIAGAGLGVWSVSRGGSALLPFFSAPEQLAASVFDIGGRMAFGALIWIYAGSIAVWLALPYALALFSAFAQGALVFAPSKLKPKLNRVSPLGNAKQKYGPDGLFNFAKSFSKLCVYALVLALLFWSRINEILYLPVLPAAAIIALAAEICFRFIAASALVIFLFAIVDYFWQRAQFLRRQRMTLKEMRDETKETEGDPYTKQARRQRGYDIATNRMMAEVPNADVVIVNPEHYAIALQWDRLPGTAPICVAKGLDEVAARIRETATEHGIPIYRDPPTARAVYATVEIGQEVQVDHYRSIAAAIRFADNVRKKSR
ncbi:MAG: flagellar type III secretion system protein FlhB [Pseudomonadota bacterium]